MPYAGRHVPQEDCQALCPLGTLVHDLVYVTADDNHGLIQVATVDVNDAGKMPAVGIVIEMLSDQKCWVRFVGKVLVEGLTPGRRYYVGVSGQPVLVAPVFPAITQQVGYALNSSTLLLQPDTTDASGGGGGGINPAQHRELDQLVHRIAETDYCEITYAIDGLVTNVSYWSDNTKVLKIREHTYTYIAGRVNVEVTLQYDALGVLVETLTETHAYDINGRLDHVDSVLT